MRGDRPHSARSARKLSGLTGAVLAGLLLLPLQLARADDAPPEAAQPCLSCHGEPLAEGVPAIAGRGNNYIQTQLVFFRSGRRKNEIMQGMAGGLSDNDIRTLGKYFSSLPVPNLSAPPDDRPELTKAGAEAAARARCANCHGDDFTGAQAAPRVKQLPEAYLAKALTDYRDATRPSSGGAAMTEVAGSLSDDDIKELAHYLAVMP
jgi:cytochrome c553